MAGDINVVVMVGRITRDAELKYSGSGTAICNFSIAVNRRVKKGEQWTDEASFFDLALFGKTAESMNKFLTKGQQVAVNGALKMDRWEKDGQKMSKVGIFVESVQLLGGRKEGGQAPARSEGNPPSRDPDPDFDPHAYEDDPIPF